MTRDTRHRLKEELESSTNPSIDQSDKPEADRNDHL